MAVSNAGVNTELAVDPFTHCLQEPWLLSRMAFLKEGGGFLPSTRLRTFISYPVNLPSILSPDYTYALVVLVYDSFPTQPSNQAIKQSSKRTAIYRLLSSQRTRNIPTNHSQWR